MGAAKCRQRGVFEETSLRAAISPAHGDGARDDGW